MNLTPFGGVSYDICQHREKICSCIAPDFCEPLRATAVPDMFDLRLARQRTNAWCQRKQPSMRLVFRSLGSRLSPVKFGVPNSVNVAARRPGVISFRAAPGKIYHSKRR